MHFNWIQKKKKKKKKRTVAQPHDHSIILANYKGASPWNASSPPCCTWKPSQPTEQVIANFQYYDDESELPADVRESL